MEKGGRGGEGSRGGGGRKWRREGGRQRKQTWRFREKITHWRTHLEALLKRAGAALGVLPLSKVGLSPRLALAALDLGLGLVLHLPVPVRHLRHPLVRVPHLLRHNRRREQKESSAEAP